MSSSTSNVNNSDQNDSESPYSFFQSHDLTDISEKIRSAPTYNSTTHSRNNLFPSINQSVVMLGQTEIVSGNVLVILVGESWDQAVPSEFHLISIVQPSIISTYRITGPNLTREMFYFNCLEISFPILSDLGLSQIKPSNLNFHVVPGVLFSYTSKRQIDDDSSLKSSDNFKLQKSKMYTKASRV